MGPGKSWNLIIWIQRLKSYGIFVQVIQFYFGVPIIAELPVIRDCPKFMQIKHI